MAMGSDIGLAKEATASLYNKIILPLCDDFSSHGMAVANRVLITMSQAFCRSEKGKEARQILQDFQLSSQEHFLDRHRELSKPRALSLSQRKAVKKAFILSRISVGADIAITSLIIARTKKALVNAEIFLVGPDHLQTLFHDDDLHYLVLPYNREGSFVDKMEMWPRLFNLISEASKDLAPDEILLLDPDTRLTQLGLLPLTYPSSTHYLCTREDRSKKQSLRKITHNWLNHVFPDTPPSSAYFKIKSPKLAHCQKFTTNFKPSTFKVLINFGVANDHNKRLPDPFEEELLASLLEQRDTLIILDSGKGKEEETLAKRLMAKMAKRGYNTIEIIEKDLTEANIPFQHGLIRFTGRIDLMAGLIINSDLFIGYDSCGQHVATATETPSIICFTGAPNKRFLQRWQPGNQHGKTTTFTIDHKKPLANEKLAELIEKIVKTAGKYRA